MVGIAWLNNFTFILGQSQTFHFTLQPFTTLGCLLKLMNNRNYLTRLDLKQNKTKSRIMGFLTP